MKLFNPANGYSSTDSTETYNLRDVSTPLATLRASGSGLGSAIFDDLGTGTLYGQANISSTSNNSIVSIPLTSVSAVNASIGGMFALGGSLSTIDPFQGQTVFTGSGLPQHTRQLVLTLFSPEDWYSFDVTAGARIRLETSTPGHSNTLNPKIDLFDPSGNLVDSGDALADGRNESLQFTATTTGVYRVRVIREGPTIGEYFLTKNLRPVITELAAPPIDENGAATVSGTIIDDSQDSHIVVVTWGPGEGSTLTLGPGRRPWRLAQSRRQSDRHGVEQLSDRWHSDRQPQRLP